METEMTFGIGSVPLSRPASNDQLSEHMSNSSSSISSECHSPLRASSPTEQPTIARRVGGKSNVTSACVPCKRAHLACDVSRPCKRCTTAGKEGYCEDVPHKKRGRPRVPKAALGVPYSRARITSNGDMGAGMWRDPASIQNPYNQSQLPQSYPANLRIDPNGYSSFGRSSGEPASIPSPPLFTVFTTTELRVLRCTAGSYQLTGFRPQDFVNTTLLDWVMPQDRGLLQLELNRLMTNPMGPGSLHTDRETQEAIAVRSEKELSSPVEGMREPYPNQNVRIMRADQQYSLFNVRLHLGGGLGGSLWHPETLGRVYFVVSLLLLPPPPMTPSPNPPPVQSSIPVPRLRIDIRDPPNGQEDSIRRASASSYFQPSASLPPLQSNSTGASPSQSGFLVGTPGMRYPMAPDLYQSAAVSLPPTPASFGPTYPYSNPNQTSYQQVSPKSASQTYTTIQVKQEHTYMESPRSMQVAQAYALGHHQSAPLQGFYDSRLEPYQIPPEEPRQWEREAGLGQHQADQHDMNAARSHPGSRQGSMGQDPRPLTEGPMSLGQGYGELKPGMWEVEGARA